MVLSEIEEDEVEDGIYYLHLNHAVDTRMLLKYTKLSLQNTNNKNGSGNQGEDGDGDGV
jgi:hypothetical protein